MCVSSNRFEYTFSKAFSFSFSLFFHLPQVTTIKGKLIKPYGLSRTASQRLDKPCTIFLLFSTISIFECDDIIRKRQTYRLYVLFSAITNAYRVGQKKR